MTSPFPESVISDGSVSVLWVPTLLDQDVPALSELQAVSVLDATCYFTDAGWQPNLTEDPATDNRLCSRQNFQSPGRQTIAIPLIYVSNPADPTEDEAALTFIEGTVGYFVDRRGVPYEDPYAAGDIVTVYKVKLGAQQDAPPTANAPLTVTQNAYLQLPGRSWRVPVVAS
jgi:hypothetical protein